MKARIRRYRHLLIVLLHVALVAFSFWAALMLRFDGEIPEDYGRAFWKSLPWLIGIRAVVFWRLKLFRGLWRYASVWDLKNIIIGVSVSSLIFSVIARSPIELLPHSRSVTVVDSIILVILLGGARMARRAIHEFDRLQAERRVLVYGAGDAGELIVRDMKNNRFYNSDPIGFVDDDPDKVGRSIHGVRVLGTRDDLATILERERPHEVLVAMPRAEPAQIRALVKSLEPFKIPIKTLPSLKDILSGRVEVSQIRNLSLEDLMSRERIGLDDAALRKFVGGRRVLVTGAGGSIGSELSRQLATFGPSRLLLVERYENALFDLIGDLSLKTPSCTPDAIIADVTDADRIERVFADAKPEIVFHAAAHKHVPLMEANPSEAVKNNVRGTRLVAEAALRHGASEFVFISTDKAVNPSSVMGATKRVAEQVVRSMNRPGGTHFVAVRFGNVLGSNGSVTRTFAAQIARGGPVTVTHPDIRRFFMLIPEAVQLVLHAAAMKDAGSIYALEMGEQVRLQDLARNMIRLSGFVPDEEIQIKFVGLRPGEKLYEELVEENERAENSAVEKVQVVRSSPPPADLRTIVPQLEAAALAGQDADVIRLLNALVPTFRPLSDPAPLRESSVVPMRRS
jgi:FlaA1/EpsC-like NDP-sugar epimerase